MNSVSVLVVARNDADRVESALHSALWADEVLLADGGSADATLEVARRIGVGIVQPMHDSREDLIRQGEAACSSEWILLLDADQRCTDALADEIRKLLAGSPDRSAYRIPTRIHFMGQWLAHSSCIPADPEPRLFKKSQAISSQAETSGLLQQPLSQMPYRNLEEFQSDRNRASSMRAALEGGASLEVTKTFFTALGAFFDPLLRRRGYLDGWPGLYLAFQSLVDTVQLAAKRHEIRERWRFPFSHAPYPPHSTELTDTPAPATSPLLSITIPTFNRSRYLAELLPELVEQCRALPNGAEEVEIVILDNASYDETEAYLTRHFRESVRHIRHRHNIGGDANFIECVRNARGRYVWIFGDDDLLTPGGVARVLQHLRATPGFLIAGSDFAETQRFPNYANLLDSALRKDPTYHISHTLITCNIFPRDAYDMDTAIRTLPTSYSHMFAIAEYLNRAVDMVVLGQQESAFMVREQRAEFHAPVESIKAKHIDYARHLAKVLGQPRLGRDVWLKYHFPMLLALLSA